MSGVAPIRLVRLLRYNRRRPDPREPLESHLMSLTEANSPSPTSPPPPSSSPRAASEPLALPEIEIAPPEPAKPRRLESLDIFRGITIASMLLVNNPGSWSNTYGPLKHADWHGWTPTDLIFPFFLFIVGVAIPFSLSKRAGEKDVSRGGILAGIWSRALALVMLGLLLQGLPSGTFDPLPPGYGVLGFLRVATIFVIGVSFVLLLFPWRSKRLSVVFPLVVAVVFAVLYAEIFFATRKALQGGIAANFNFGSGILTPWKMRFPGVLQRIGVCYGVAATIALFAGWRTVLASAIVLMAAYSALMLAAPFENHVRGSLTKEDNLARRIDEKVFSRTETMPDGTRRTVVQHNYGAYPDPEGLLSTLPAIGSVLIGILVGLGLRNPGAAPAEKAARVLAWGVFATVLGVLLGWWLMPINKQIWTPSFTVFTAGMGMLGLGAIYYLADVRGRRAWALPFKIYGMNAIAAFVFSGLLVRIGQLIKVTDPASPTQKVPLIRFCQAQLNDAVHAFGGWVRQLSPHLPVIDTPNNVSLAYALAFVLVIFILMSVMYACRIFLKV